MFEDENTELVERSKIMTQQPNTVENTIIFYIKIVFVEHPKTIYKLSKTIWQAEKVSQEIGANKNSTSPLLGKQKQKKWKCKNNETITCSKRICKYLYCWNFDFLKSELQYKDNECKTEKTNRFIV